jgi:uncharacterized membrane protein
LKQWSFDILRQTDWGLWVWVCAAACLSLLAFALFTHPWRRGPRGWCALALIAGGLLGTIAVLAIPQIHSARVGLFWTFALLGILSATFYLELIDRLGIGRTATLLTLRLMALVAAVPMLFEPGCRYIRQPQPERPVLFVVDTSGSMSFPDVQNGPTRIESVWQTLNPQLGKINEHFLPRYFTFSTGVDELKKPEELEGIRADGKATDIANAVLKTMSQSTRDDAAVVLISDGNDNTSPDVVEAIRAARHPVYTVRVGSELTEPGNLANIAVTDVDVADDFVVGHESQVKATIKSTALPNRVVDVQMAEVDADGKQLSSPVSRKLVLQPLPEGQTVTLPYKPQTVGVHRLAVWVDPVAGERSIVDNRQEFQGLAIDPRIKVLYIEGRARPEFRDLNRMLGRDPNIELATLLRIQKDRFAASGSVDGQTFHQMPTGAEEWKKFDVILLGDLDSSFLPPIQQVAIEQRVLDGGGLMMIGGENSFGPGNYQGTPIERALPVLVGSASMPQEKEQFVPRMTPSGLLHPAMEGLADYFGSDNKPPTKSLPVLRGNVVVPQAKAGAEVLLIHPDRNGPDGKPEIVLAVERYGKGRSAAFTIDTTYLWALPLYGLGQDSPYNRIWGQLVRWLAGADVRNRQRGPGLEGLLNKSVYAMGESVRLRALVRDERGDATQYAQVNMKLSQSGQPDRSFPLDPVTSHTGMYELLIPHPDKGDWTMQLSANKDGKLLGSEQIKFTVIPPAEEMLKIAANPQLLAAVANATGGSAYNLPELPGLIDELIRTDRHSVGAKQVFLPLYDFPRAALMLTGHDVNWPSIYDLPVQGLLVLVLLSAEWILRRVWQLS